jgi:peptidoglycan/LPS O-acetylase OafA/YrhL
MRWKLPPLRVESQDFLHLDTLRFLAAMGVVAFHWRETLSLGAPWNGMAAGIGGFSLLVDLFFVISGFIICHVYSARMASLSDYLSFLGKRLARLGPLHWATLALFAAIGIAAPLAGVALSHAENYNFACFVPNLVFVHAFGVCPDMSFNYPSWSISAEMACYALFPLYLALYRVRVWLPGLVAIGLIAFYALSGFVGAHERAWYDLTFDFGALRALPSFGLGVSLYGLRRSLTIPFAGEAMYALIGAFIVLGELGAPLGALLVIAYLIVLCGASADSHGRVGPVTRALAPLGSLTYSLYMLHVPFATFVFKYALVKFAHVTPGVLNYATWLGAPALLAVSYLSYVAFETPARRWLTARLSAKRASPLAPRPAATPES